MLIFKNITMSFVATCTRGYIDSLLGNFLDEEESRVYEKIVGEGFVQFLSQVIPQATNGPLEPIDALNKVLAARAAFVAGGDSEDYYTSLVVAGRIVSA